MFNFERFIMKSITSALLLISALAFTGAVQAKGPYASGTGHGSGGTTDASATGAKTQRRTQDPALHQGETAQPRRDRLQTQTQTHVVPAPVAVDASTPVTQ